ncbi:hypothetical protein NPIL_554661, partial [Nephila pilipes]
TDFAILPVPDQISDSGNSILSHLKFLLNINERGVSNREILPPGRYHLESGRSRFVDAIASR